MSETKSRIISAAFALPIVFLFIFIDHWSVDVVFYLFSVFFLSKEILAFSTNMNSKDRRISFFFVFLTAIIQLFCLHAQDGKYFSNIDQILVFAIAIEILIFFLIHLTKNSFEHLFNKQQSLVYTLFFTNFFLSFFLKLKYFSKTLDSEMINFDLRNQIDNYYLLYIMVIVWIYDSMAYFGGKFLGKKKLGIAVSPNKTWMGLFFGLASAPLSFLLLGEIIKLNSFELYENSIFSNLSLGVFLSIIIALIAQFGDLMASLIKRSVGIKDSGVFLKGHGGFLDRIDSLIPTTFFFYYFLVLWY